MSKRYYCDYCNKTMSCAPSIIKTHNNGLMHQRAKLDHFQKFKDPEVILQEESQKQMCGRFPYGQCQFGSVCRFSHYSPEAIQLLKNYVTTKQLADSVVALPCFQDLYERFQTEKSVPGEDGDTVLVDKNGVAHKLPWCYNTVLDNYGTLPPSIRRLNVEDFNNAGFSEWGCNLNGNNTNIN